MECSAKGNHYRFYTNQCRSRGEKSVSKDVLEVNLSALSFLCKLYDLKSDK